MFDNGNTIMTVIGDSVSLKIVINEFSTIDGSVVSTSYKTTGTNLKQVASAQARGNYMFMVVYGLTTRLAMLDRTTGTFTGEPAR